MIVVFDAHCLLCSYWVKFLLKHDRSQTIKFASIQTMVGKQLLADAGLRVDKLETLLVLDNNQSWQHTTAILKVLSLLGWPWKLAAVARIVPTPVRDLLYQWVARNRYTLFGQTETCLVPSEATAHRFLSD
jgi:predicted DCC family thiol-disulfide oxidoreductase YuxK